jgi:hypothetical protein
VRTLQRSIFILSIYYFFIIHMLQSALQLPQLRGHRMRKYDFIQITGFVCMVLGAQNAIRQLINPTDGGLLAWVPGGSGTQVATGIVVGITGAVLTGWAYNKARQFDRRGDDKQADDRDSDWL